MNYRKGSGVREGEQSRMSESVSRDDEYDKADAAAHYRHSMDDDSSDDDDADPPGASASYSHHHHHHHDRHHKSSPSSPPAALPAPWLTRPLSPTNPFLVICHGLYSSHGQSVPTPPSDARLPVSCLPLALYQFLTLHQHSLLDHGDTESSSASGYLPAWMTIDHVKLLTRLFDMHVRETKQASYPHQHHHHNHNHNQQLPLSPLYSALHPSPSQQAYASRADSAAASPAAIASSTPPLITQVHSSTLHHHHAPAHLRPPLAIDGTGNDSPSISSFASFSHSSPSSSSPPPPYSLVASSACSSTSCHEHHLHHHHHHPHANSSSLAHPSPPPNSPANHATAVNATTVTTATTNSSASSHAGSSSSSSSSSSSPSSPSAALSPSGHFAYTSPRQQQSTAPSPPPPLPAALLKQTTRVAELIRRLYGLQSEEKGHRTLGHSCLTADDQQLAAQFKCDLLYGEVLPEGVSRMFDTDHLDLLTARTVYDLGSGLGKLAFQAFLQFPHLDAVCGVELARSRSLKGFDALRKLAKMRLQSSPVSSSSSSTTTTSGMLTSGSVGVGLGGSSSINTSVIEESKDSLTIRLTETTKTSLVYSKCLGMGRAKKSKKTRHLQLQCGDLFGVTEAWQADVVICETKFPEEKYRELAVYLAHLKPQCRLLTYEDLDHVYASCRLVNPFVRFDCNHVNDRFYTTWAPNYGYRFHLWRKKPEHNHKLIDEEKREEKHKID